MNVEAILKKKGTNVFTIRPDRSVGELAVLVSSKKIGAAIVSEPLGPILGIVSERDIVRAVAGHGKAALDLTIRDIMTSPVLTCFRSDSVKHVLQTMTQRRIRHLPVVEDGRLIGIVSIGDAVNQRLQETQEEVEVLREIAVARR